MKLRTALPLLTALLLPTTAHAVKVGQKVPGFKLKGSDGKTHTLGSYKQPVLVVVYQGSSSWKQNMKLIKKLVDLRKRKRLPPSRFQVVSISNFQESALPNAVLRAILKRIARSQKLLMLFDTKGTLRKTWGFRNGRSNIYVLDGKRRLRWRGSGPLSRRSGKRLLRLVKRLVRAR